LIKVATARSTSRLVQLIDILDQWDGTNRSKAPNIDAAAPLCAVEDAFLSHSVSTGFYAYESRRRGIRSANLSPCFSHRASLTASGRSSNETHMGLPGERAKWTRPATRSSSGKPLSLISTEPVLLKLYPRKRFVPRRVERCVALLPDFRPACFPYRRRA
jgi:hypothetical protein